jgi:hypothetical protein
MPQMVSNQTIVGFVRRLQAGFSGFNSQNIMLGGHPVQMLHGAMLYNKNKIFLAVFASPQHKKDCVVMTLSLFNIPEQGTEELFEQLLSWNNGATEVVRFTVDEVVKTINLMCVRLVEGLSFDEFQRCLDSILNVAKNSVDRLQREYGLIRIG